MTKMTQSSSTDRKLHRQNEAKSSKRTKIHTTSSENEVVERSKPEEIANQKK